MYFKRLLIQHKEKKVDRSLKIIKVEFYKENFNSNSVSKSLTEIEKDLNKMKNNIYNNGINKVIDFYIPPDLMINSNNIIHRTSSVIKENDLDSIKIITEPFNGIPIFEWVLQRVGNGKMFMEN